MTDQEHAETIGRLVKELVTAMNAAAKDGLEAKVLIEPKTVDAPTMRNADQRPVAFVANATIARTIVL